MIGTATTFMSVFELKAQSVCVCVYVRSRSVSSSGIVEPSGFRVLGIVGALGDTFQ